MASSFALWILGPIRWNGRKAIKRRDLQKRRRVNKRTRADWQRFLGLGKRRNRAEWGRAFGLERRSRSGGSSCAYDIRSTNSEVQSVRDKRRVRSRVLYIPRECIMCEKRGMCTGKRQVPLLVVTTLLVGVRPELVGEYKLIYRDKKGCRCKYLNGANGSL